MKMVPKHQPKRINLSGAKIIKNHHYVTRPGFELYGPDSLHAQDSLDIYVPGKLDSELSDKILEGF